ncbi:uncharacterized protein LOC119657720 [Hermetia illucens]|uniref:uncharacterized protein LOC119657720 n=1 Tax=Hermetia illucens TaxID=343691 RepID=UPI0018CC72A6|nr:uncharacterized protein LOC119657720 [Hermetia illucens]
MRNILTLIFCILCLVLEILGFLFVALNYGSACIQAGEITENAYAYMILIYAVATSDLFYTTVVWFLPGAALRDFIFVYHIGALVVSLAGSIAIFAGLTFCGNAAQVFFFLAGLVGVVAAVFHAVIALIVRKKLPVTSKFSKGHT